MSEDEMTDEESEAEPKLIVTGKNDPEFQPKEIIQDDKKNTELQPRRSSRYSSVSTYHIITINCCREQQSSNTNLACACMHTILTSTQR